MRALRITACVILTAFFHACAFKHATLFPPPPAPKKPLADAYAVVLLFDGARPQDLDSLVTSGQLPNIKRLFYDGGARFQDALAVVPTASTPSHQSFISGLFPGHHGIPSLDWFSRPLGKYIDYLRPKDMWFTNTYMFNFKQVEARRIETDRPQLIFHDLQGHPTLTVFEPTNSGATDVLSKHFPVLTAFHGKVEKFYEAFDLEAMRLTLEHFRKVPPEQLPRFSYVSFYGMDLVTHFDGILGDRVQDLYLQYDRFLGELERVLRDRGIWEKTTLVVLSDHGQHALTQVTDLPSILHRVGLKYNLSRPDEGQVMFGDHGLSFTNLYLKAGKDWQGRPTYHDLKNFPLEKGRRLDLIAALEAEPDIEFVVAAEGPWRVHVHRQGKHALIERRTEGPNNYYSYLPDPGGDPLDYLDDPRIASWTKEKKFVDAESWLSATGNKKFPDAVVLLSQIFADYRVGDLLLFTVKDSQFKEKRLAGHGSFYAEDLKVVLLFHGPNIRPGIYSHARSVDLYPTFLALFGLSPSGPIDGVLRPEIFKTSPEVAAFAQTVGSRTDSSLSSFQEKLRQKLKNESLTREEKEKALQLLYASEQFEKDCQRYAMPGNEGRERGLAQQP